jgi:hypothetical protein
VSDSKQLHSEPAPPDQRAIDHSDIDRDANVAHGIALVGLVWIAAGVLVMLIVLLASSVGKGPLF